MGCQDIHNLCWSKEHFRKNAQKKKMFFQKVPRKCFLGEYLFHVPFFEIFLQILCKSAYNSGFVTPILTYFERKNFPLLDGTYCTSLTENITSSVQKFKIRKKYQVLGFRSLSKKAWTNWILKKGQNHSILWYIVQSTKTTQRQHSIIRPECTLDYLKIAGRPLV